MSDQLPAGFVRPYGVLQAERQRAADRALARMDRAEELQAPRPRFRPIDYRNARDDQPLVERYRWHSIRRLVFIPTQSPRWQVWNNHGPASVPFNCRADAVAWIDATEGGPVSSERLEEIRAARAENDAASNAWANR